MRAPYNKTYSVGLNPQYRLYPVTGSPYYDQAPAAEFTDEDKAARPVGRRTYQHRILFPRLS